MTVKTEPSVAPPISARTHVNRASSPTEPARANRRLRALLRQLVSFGLVGGVAFVVDVGIYNVLRSTILDDKPIGAKVISVAVATIVAWLGNRALTFREQRGQDAQPHTVGGGKRAVWREGALFALMNVIGLGIAALCLFVSHYVLGYTSTLADNIAGNGVGLVLGMTFRFLAYRYLVFRRPAASAGLASTALASTALASTAPSSTAPSNIYQPTPAPSTTAPIGGVS